MNDYVLLLPYKTGVFTSADKLLYELREGGSIEDYKVAYDWKEAAYLIRNKYSLECLFLMGLEDLSVIPKNITFSVPLASRGQFTESKIQEWRRY